MFLIKKFKIILLFLLVFLGLFVVLQSALACPGTGIFDYTSAVLDALDFIDMAVLKVLVLIMVASIISSCYVILAAWLLQWSSQLPLYLDAPVVQGGWYFILGLVNLFIILAMVFIALAYILKIESLELKKTLPKLIIVIVLVNFSMLITGIFVDIAQFFMNTLMTAYGTDFIEMAIMPLRNSIGALINVYSTTIMGFVVSAFIPFGSIISLSIILTRFLTGDLLGSIFTTIVLIFLNISLGTTFFVYFVLFVVRIAYLWLLTIFSPLAFLSFVFKQTESYGKKWFTSVIQWASLGVILFFLLGLITTLFYDAFIERPGDIEIKGAAGLPVLNLPNAIYNYLFLLLFLQIAYRTSLALAPAGAKQFAALVEGQIKSMGGVAGISKKIAGRVNKRQTERMQEAGANLAGRLPLVGRDIKASYRQKREKQVGEESKKLEHLTDKERQKIIDSPWSSVIQKQSALEVNAKKGALRPQDETHIKRAVAYGGDPKVFTNAMPTLAGDLKEITEKKWISRLDKQEAIKSAVRAIGPKKFAENVQASTFSTDGKNNEQIDNIHAVFQAMSRAQLKEVAKQGSQDLKIGIFNYTQDQIKPRGRIRRDLEEMRNRKDNQTLPQEIRDKAKKEINSYQKKMDPIVEDFSI